MVNNITEFTIPENEGYPQVLCTTIIAHILKKLNEGTENKPYRFEIKPIITAEIDSRSNKETDLSIIRVYNQRTYVIIELKLAVSPTISGDSKLLNDISQLLLKSIYIHETEGRGYSKLLCVLSDGLAWHFFLMDMSRKPLEVLTYISLHDLKIPVSEVIGTILYFVPANL